MGHLWRDKLTALSGPISDLLSPRKDANPITLARMGNKRRRRGDCRSSDGGGAERNRVSSHRGTDPRDDWGKTVAQQLTKDGRHVTPERLPTL